MRKPRHPPFSPITSSVRFFRVTAQHGEFKMNLHDDAHDGPQIKWGVFVDLVKLQRDVLLLLIIAGANVRHEQMRQHFLAVGLGLDRSLEHRDDQIRCTGEMDRSYVTSYATNDKQ